MGGLCGERKRFRVGGMGCMGGMRGMGGMGSSARDQCVVGRPFRAGYSPKELAPWQLTVPIKPLHGHPTHPRN